MVKIKGKKFRLLFLKTECLRLTMKMTRFSTYMKRSTNKSKRRSALNAEYARNHMQSWRIGNLYLNNSDSQFCGALNCPQCLFKSRPFPINNPMRDRRGLICVVCNKKFLYRDVSSFFKQTLGYAWIRYWTRHERRSHLEPTRRALSWGRSLLRPYSDPNPAERSQEQ